MESWRHLFVLFGGLIRWGFNLFRGSYEKQVKDEESYFNFFIGLVCSLAIVIVIGRLIQYWTE